MTFIEIHPTHDMGPQGIEGELFCYSCRNCTCHDFIHLLKRECKPLSGMKLQSHTPVLITVVHESHCFDFEERSCVWCSGETIADLEAECPNQPEEEPCEPS